jgi:AraC-like DNA-binding protein
MADHLAEAPAPGQALAAAVVDRLASAGATEADLPGPGLAAALRAEQGPGGVRQVARTLGVTERQLHRRCVTHFGYGPKTVQRVLRFQDALAMARSDRPLALVAAEAGYADQAHLARDVRALAGATLTELLAGR